MLSWIHNVSGMADRLQAKLRHGVGTAVMGLVAGLIFLTAAGFLVAAFYSWLGYHLPTHLALLATAGALILVGLIVYAAIRLRSPAPRPARPVAGSPLDDVESQAERATEEVAAAARQTVRHDVSGALLTAVVAGIAVGLFRPTDRS